MLVAESDSLVIGYVSSSGYRPKQAFETSVETSIYLAPTQGGRGIGSSPPLTAALAEHLTWRQTYAVLAVVLAAITIPARARPTGPLADGPTRPTDQRPHPDRP